MKHQKSVGNCGQLNNGGPKGAAGKVGKMSGKKTYDSIQQFNDDVMSVYQSTKLSNEQKVAVAKTMFTHLRHSPVTYGEERAKDVPIDALIVKNTEYGDWSKDQHCPDINYPPLMGLDLNRPIIPLGRKDSAKLPDKGVRYGGHYGYNFSSEKEGMFPNLDNRSVPKEYIPEQERRMHFNHERYCVIIDAINLYKTAPDEALEIINREIEKFNTEHNTELKVIDLEQLEQLYEFYMHLQNTDFAELREALAAPEEFTKYGVFGYAAPIIVKGKTICKGGAVQYNTALREKMLENLGIETPI